MKRPLRELAIIERGMRLSNDEKTQSHNMSDVKELFLLKYLKNKIITIAPRPYIPENGPYKKLCLLSKVPFETIENNTSTT